MAPKQVYGKRPKTVSSFTVSTKFAWSSPSKGDSDSAQDAGGKENLEVTVTALNSLGIEDSEDKSPVRPSGRRALINKDNNVRNQAPKSPQQKPLLKVKRKGIKEVNDIPANIEPKKSPTQDSLPTPPPSEPAASSDNTENLPQPPKDPYLEPILSLCSDTSIQQSPTPFSSWSSTLEPYFNIVKIAEASYGEVYRLCLKEAHPNFTSSDESVLKILPLKPPPTSKKKAAAQKKREEQMSEVASVASEVKLLQRMSPIPGFTNFRGVLVLRGRPSQPFMDAWREFNNAQPKGEKSVFPDPIKKASYSDEQLWAVIEMQDAGVDLEHVELKTVWEVWDVFWGIALALAKGEEEARFEHRDLHLGNICVRSSRKDEKVGETGVRSVEGRQMGFTGLETTIIDYTLSRSEMGSRDDIAFMDLEEQEWLFEQDASEEYQYEIYRCMRRAVCEKPKSGFDDFFELFTALESPPAARNAKRKPWREFCPLTNVIWLHYVLHKLLQPLEEEDGTQKLAMSRLDDGQDQLIAETTSSRLDGALRQLRKLLAVDNSGLIEPVSSVRDLIAIALEEGWLDESDVVGTTGSVLSLEREESMERSVASRFRKK